MLAGIVLSVLLAVVALVVRRRVLQHLGGAVDCSLRFPGLSPWVLGVGRYEGDTLRWYRVFSLTLRPRYEFSRRRLVVLNRRHPDESEAEALLAGAVVISCRHRDDPVELAFSEPARTGFLAWLEAAPPGTHTRWS